MILYFTILSLALCQDYNNFESQTHASILLNNSDINTQMVANIKNESILFNTIKPDEYIVGPGDEFYLSFSSNDFSFNNYLIVTPTGNIIVPTVGVLNISKMTLNEAYSIIENSCTGKYKNSNINISLTDIRSFYVKILGLPYGNSKLLVNSLNTASDAFEIFISNLNKNLRSKVSQRNILLNSDVNIDYLLNKSNTNHRYYLKEGDTLTLFEQDLFVDILGGVKNPGRYEFFNGDYIQNIIQLAGGLSSSALDEALLIRNKDGAEIIININDRIPISPYDYIIIKNKSPISRYLVNISGEVNMPGDYIIKENMTYLDLINLSGGYTKNADTSKISINNDILASNLDNEFKRINLISPQKRSKSEISYLKSRSMINSGQIQSSDYNTTQIILDYIINIGDNVVVVPRVNFVEVIGGITNPGRYPFNDNFSISDYIEESGGKTSKAKNNIYIINMYNDKKLVKDSYTDIKNGEIIFIETKEDFNLWNKLRDSMALIGQLATLIAVIQSANN